MLLCRFTRSADYPEEDEFDRIIRYPIYAAPPSALPTPTEHERPAPAADPASRHALIAAWFAIQTNTFTSADLSEAFNITAGAANKHLTWGLQEHRIRIIGSRPHSHGGWTRIFQTIPTG
jgi:hypothetical protein